MHSHQRQMHILQKREEFPGIGDQDIVVKEGRLIPHYSRSEESPSPK